MKRIIEIPDKVVEAIQNGEDYRYDIHTAIAQSTPYNPSGDLISREALKKTICLDEIISVDETWEQLYDAVVKAIDNAPTVPQVTVFTETADEKAIADLKAELQSVIEPRHQGEWKFTTHHARRYRVCPFCAAEKLDDLSAGWNFCWHCGAQMKGGAE